MYSNSFSEKPWPPLRNLVTDFLGAARNKNNIKGFFEADVTLLKEKIAEQRLLHKKVYLPIAYLIWCYAKALDKHKEIQALRKGNKLIIFEEVDINFMLEKKLPNGESIPVAYIFRSANKKSFEEINHELKEAIKNDQADNEIVKARRKIASKPRFLRRFFWRRIENDPLLHKKHRGTVALTTVGMFTADRPYWADPITPMPCTLTGGSMYKKPVFMNGEIKNATVWCLTLTVDHDITDGAPATRFGDYLCNLLESCEGLQFENMLPENIENQ